MNWCTRVRGVPGLGRRRFRQAVRAFGSTPTAAGQRGDSQTDSTANERRPVFITTPIFYVNASPHVGHLYSACVADALARWYRICGEDAFLLTGTDEHGLKVQQAAAAAGKTELEFCDDISMSYRRVFDDADISYNRFIRTTEDQHASTVRAAWEVLHARGHVYLGYHEGWYCVADEAFVPASQVAPSEDVHEDQEQTYVSTESGRPVEWVAEPNYKFRLGAQLSALKHWYSGEGNKRGSPISPKSMQDFMQTTLDEMLSRQTVTESNNPDSSTPVGRPRTHGKADARDLSVSRPSSRVSWGIDVPNDSDHTVYVWLDALLNYLTAANSIGQHNRLEPDEDTAEQKGKPTAMEEHVVLWPPDHQIIGKDIAKFHCIYWPAFLGALGLSMPRHVHSHGHWLVDGRKMSKSSGNVMAADQALKLYGSDAVRYFLLREGGGSTLARKDCDYSNKELVAVVNSELANNLGNLLLRVTAPKLLPAQCMPPQPSQIDPVPSLDADFMAHMDATLGKADVAYRECQFGVGVRAVADLLHHANRYFQASAPWACEPGSEERARILFNALEAVRIAAILLQPVTPSLAARCLHMLGVPEGVQRGRAAASYAYETPGGEPRRFNSPAVLFHKVELASEENRID